MPLHRNKDRYGNYWQYGTHGHRYYYVAGHAQSRLNAKKKALKQAVAISYKSHRPMRLK